MLFNAVVMNFPTSTLFKILSIMQSVPLPPSSIFIINPLTTMEQYRRLRVSKYRYFLPISILPFQALVSEVSSIWYWYRPIPIKCTRVGSRQQSARRGTFSRTVSCEVATYGETQRNEGAWPQMRQTK